MKWVVYPVGVNRHIGMTNIFILSTNILVIIWQINTYIESPNIKSISIKPYKNLTCFVNLVLVLSRLYHATMSDSFVLYRKATEWFEEGKTVTTQLGREEADLDEKEAEWAKERMERRAKIAEIKCRIQENYGRKESVRRNKKIISNYNKRITEEAEMMKKMEYATKCLDFIKGEMIEDAGGQQAGIKECQVGDELSKHTTRLCEFLEGMGDDKEIITYRACCGGRCGRVDIPVYAPAEALYSGSTGKFIKNVDGTVVEDNFPSIFELKREGFSLDDVIGLAHLQFIGGIRDDGQVQFNWVPESKDWDSRFMEGYHGVTFPPEYFLKNEHQSQKDGRDWRYTILIEKPAKMYIRDTSQCEHISSMEDILEDGRLYDNRFGIKYDSTPDKIYWEFDTEV
jgi:hypothetical protein